MKQLAASVSVLALLALPASADIVISNGATKNMSCSAGVCTSTATNAVLNATDLANMLAAGDATVTTGAGAVSIAVDAAFSWTSASRLTLLADQNVTVSATMSVAGPGGLTVTTGTGGDFAFLSGGQADFWQMSSSLIINGTAYTLVDDIHSLAAAVKADPSGSYAFADSYDASGDGSYKNHAVPTLTGNFDGLGHTIDKPTVRGKKNYNGLGFFEDVNGTVRDIHLTNVKILLKGFGFDTVVGGLTGQAGGDALIVRASVSGSVTGGPDSIVGGLVGNNFATLSLCNANVSVVGRFAGGLAGWNGGVISQSWAAGQVTAAVSDQEGMEVGGLAGFADGSNSDGPGLIVQSYSTASVIQANSGGGGDAGGLAGESTMFYVSTITESYSIGAVSGSGGLGGFIGRVGGALAVSADYWDMDTSGMTGGIGGGGNVKGIKGLTTAQFQSGLPAKFDRKVWAQSPDVNNGYPYLIANPPR